MAAIYQGGWAVRLSVYWSLDGQVAQIDRLFSVGTPSFDVAWDSTDFFAGAITLGWATSFKSVITSDANYLGMKLYYKPTGAPPIIDSYQIGAGAGTRSAGYAPRQLCGLVRWQSPVGGKEGKGRDYYPFIPLEDLTNIGQVTPGYSGAIVANSGLLLAGVSCPNVGGGITPIQVKPCTKYIDPASDVPVLMNQTSVSDECATQRRRGSFGQPNRSPF